jgi:hypothetical protein
MTLSAAALRRMLAVVPVAFRAVGQEPGWVAEVDTGERPSMRVSLDHGQRQLDVGEAHRFDEPRLRPVPEPLTPSALAS